MFHNPVIPPNTGNAIRLAAVTGAALSLVEPLGFELTDARVRRAGLDYHDLSRVYVHPDFTSAATFTSTHGTGRIFAFTTHTVTRFDEIEYRPGDTLLFGTEPTGLPDAVLNDSRITQRVHIPMQPGVRSLNLSNAASIAIYEAWRQNDYTQTPAGWLPHHSTSLAADVFKPPTP